MIDCAARRFASGVSSFLSLDPSTRHCPASPLPVVGTMQWQLLFRLCYPLDNPGDVEDVMSEIGWGLFTVDEAGQPLEHIGGLHESVLETEPSGTEMKS